MTFCPYDPETDLIAHTETKADDSQLVVVHLPHNRHTPFVVWRQAADGSCHHGTYRQTRGQALEALQDRMKFNGFRRQYLTYQG